MKINKYVHSRRKGQANFYVSNEKFERVQLFCHANTLVPLRDTLHFGIKPAHFMIYVKRRGEDGTWLVKDAGYINYFRKDQEMIVQTEYNTLAKQKLLSRGLSRVQFSDDTITFHSYSVLPIHHRRIDLNLDKEILTVQDRFLWKTDIFFNFDTGLVTDTSRWYNKRVINL